MTKVETIAPKGLTPPLGPYSYAIAANGFVFVSGLLPVTPDGRKMTGDAFEVQAKQVLDNLETVLRAAATEPSKLVQVRVYMVDLEKWTAFNGVYSAWIGAARPARCVVPVPVLHYGVELEVEAVAVQ